MINFTKSPLLHQNREKNVAKNKMLRCFRLLDVFALGLLLSAVNGGVLIISPQYLEIPSLRLFDEKLYNSLKDSIENGRIVTYLWELPLECGYFGHSRNSAYLPSVIYYPDDAIGERRRSHR